jgi:SAM-dependent methyltransferase
MSLRELQASTLVPGTGRTLEQLRNHYEVEKALADQLKAARTPAERAPIFATMYADLFARVPDHPRLTVRCDPQRERAQVLSQLRLLARWLKPHVEYVEFGAGACAFAFEVARHVRRSRAIEIADQIPAGVARPANFGIVLYDGFTLAEPPESVDLVFSNQFVEHLHPDDAVHHFETVLRLLRPGGRYVLTTPERWTGPHDVSRWFSETPQGFHLREWSYRDLIATTGAIGFDPVAAYWTARGHWVRMPVAMALALEGMVARWSLDLRRQLGHRLLPLVVLELRRR